MQAYEAPTFEFVGALRDITLGFGGGGHDGGFGGRGDRHDRGHTYSG